MALERVLGGHRIDLQDLMIRTVSVKARKMAQQVKCLPHKHEYESLGPQNSLSMLNEM